MDEAGKMVSDDGTEVTVEGAVEDQEVEKDEDGQEVIKVYIFKADSGEDDMGERRQQEVALKLELYCWKAGERVGRKGDIDDAA